MAIATRPVNYDDQEAALAGVLAWDDAAPRPQPGLLLVHGGAGLDDHARAQARRGAEHGYAVLAGDMFGEGVAGHRASAHPWTFARAVSSRWVTGIGWGRVRGAPC